jgi:hypothetical protein
MKEDKEGIELSELANRIDAEHGRVATALQSALAHAINAGEMLIEAKRHVKRSKGKWLPWLAANCSVPARTASHYMGLAKRRLWFCDENGNVLPISVRRAVLLLNHPNTGDGAGYSEWGDYVPDTRWGGLAWHAPFAEALQLTTRLPQLNPPAPRYVAKAVRAGKTPGLTAPVLREVIALLTRYADALEGQPKVSATVPAMSSGQERANGRTHAIAS